MGSLFEVNGTNGNVTTAGSITAAGPITSSAGDVTLQNQHSLIFNDTEGTPKSVTLHAPTTLTSSYVLNLPLLQGGISTVLSNDGSGNLSWASISGSPGGSDTQFQYNSSGTFAGTSALTFDGTNLYFGTGNQVIIRVSDSLFQWGPGGVSNLVAGDGSLSVGDAVRLYSDGSATFQSQSTFKEFLVNSDGSITLGSDSGITNSIYFEDAATNTVSLSAPTTITSSYGLILPTAQGGSNTFLQNDGSGNLSWATVSSSGVSSITGTVNEVIASASTGAITLSLPQAIATTSTPTFTGLNLGTTSSPGSLFIGANGGTAGTLSMVDAGSAHSVTLQAPSSITTNYTLKFPLAQGSSNTALINDGSGNLSWSQPIGTTSIPTFSRVISSVTIPTNSSNLAFYGSSGIGANITIQAPATISYTQTLVLPAAAGGANTTLLNDGSGNLSWSQAIGTTSTPTFASETLTATSNQLVLGTTNTTTISSVAPLASRTYTIPDAGANSSFMLLASGGTVTGSYTFPSTTYFTSSLNINNAGGSAYNYHIATNPPTAGRTYTIPEAGANANFVLDQGNYTIGGSWTFGNALTVSGAITASNGNFISNASVPSFVNSVSGTNKSQFTQDSSNTYLDYSGSVGSLLFRNTFGGGTTTMVLTTAGNLITNGTITANGNAIGISGTTPALILEQSGTASSQFVQDANDTYIDYGGAIGRLFFRSGYNGSTKITFGSSGSINALDLVLVNGTSDGTQYTPAAMSAGGGSASTNFGQQTTTGVSTTATTILVSPNYGTFCMITGSNGSGSTFTDLVLMSTGTGTVNVVSSLNAGGTPSARTYSQSSSTLKLAMASGTYTINAFAMISTLR